MCSWLRWTSSRAVVTSPGASGCYRGVHDVPASDVNGDLVGDSVDFGSVVCSDSGVAFVYVRGGGGVLRLGSVIYPPLEAGHGVLAGGGLLYVSGARLGEAVTVSRAGELRTIMLRTALRSVRAEGGVGAGVLLDGFVGGGGSVLVYREVGVGRYDGSGLVGGRILVLA